MDRLEEFIDDAGPDCGKIRPGFLRVAATLLMSGACKHRSA